MTFPKIAKDILRMAAIFAVVYLANQQLQTYLGKQALAAVDIDRVSFEEAIELATANDRPIIAEFSAIWCGTCRKFDSEVLSNDLVQQQLAERFVFTRLEYESDDRAIFEKYGVSGFPTLLLLDKDGNLIRRIGLTFDPATFLQQL